MNSFTKKFGFILSVYFLTFLFACNHPVEKAAVETNVEPLADQQTYTPPVPRDENPSAPKPPNLQKEILDERGKKTAFPIGQIDFRNYTYPLPRGWQFPDRKDVQLVDGIQPASKEEKRIGLEYVTTKFLDATGDGQDDAAVILKIDTTGSAIPQIVYLFSMKDDKPELLWYFRTGDRADGGLKDIRAESGEIVVELYGQDRYIIGEVDTLKITGDEEQICCPTHFTRSSYKWNGTHFRMQGKRLTFLVADPEKSPVENMGEIVEKEGAKK